MNIDWIGILMALIYFITLYYTIFWLLGVLKADQGKPRIKNFPRVTVAIPAYNEEDAVCKSLYSVLALDYPKDRLQVIVINDGSTDSTLSRVRDVASSGKDRDIVILDQKNSGKYKALNKALELASGEFFVCLDSDSFVERGALKKMLPHFNSESVGVVIPMLKVADPKSFIQKVQWYEYVINKFYSSLISKLNCLHVAPGPFSIYRTDVLKSMGGYRKGHNTEDLEIALRLQRHGYQLVQVTDSQVWTNSPRNISELFAQRNRWNKGSFLNILDYKSMIFNRKFGDFGLFYLPLVFVSGFLVTLLVALTLYSELIRPLFSTIKNLSSVNFDLPTYFSHISFTLNLLDIDYYRLALALFIMSVTIAIVILSHSLAREKIGAHGFFPLLSAILFYYILLGIIWMGVFRDLIARKWKRW